MNGVKVYTPMPPSQKVINELKKVGDRAIPELVKVANSPEGGLRVAVSVKFLGLLESPASTRALLKLAQESPSETVRNLSVRWLSSSRTPNGDTALMEIEKSNSNEKIRKLATALREAR